MNIYLSLCNILVLLLLNPILHRLFLLSYCTGGVILTPLKIGLISLLKTTSHTFSSSLASNDRFPINFMTSSFLNFFRKNFEKFKERYHQKKIFFSRIQIFFISCPISVGFSLLFLKLAFLTFLVPKKRFFAKMRKFFEISAKIFFRTPGRGGTGARHDNDLCVKSCVKHN